MKGQRREKKKVEKLNLIPILDAVFIIIFFLLMSAKFVDLRVIGSDAPVVSQTPPPKDQKPPLALTLKVSSKSIRVQTGLNAKTHKVIKVDGKGGYNKDSLYSALVKIKKEHPGESEIIFDVRQDVQYQTVAGLMDDVQELKKEDHFNAQVKSSTKMIDKLFHKIVFSNIAG